MPAAVYFFVLVCLTPGKCDADRIVSDRAYYSLEQCEEYGRDVAASMYVKNHKYKYSYHCEKPDFQPPKAEPK